jgi:hypothetical protein
MRTQLVFKYGPSLCMNTNLKQAIGELMASNNRCLTYRTNLLYTAWTRLGDLALAIWESMIKILSKKRARFSSEIGDVIPYSVYASSRLTRNLKIVNEMSEHKSYWARCHALRPIKSFLTLYIYGDIGF